MLSLLEASKLIEHLNKRPIFSKDKKKLVILFGLLGDFDSIEYAQSLAKAFAFITSSEIDLYAIGIGNESSRKRFCSFSGFPEHCIEVVQSADLHTELNLYSGINTKYSSWINLLLMCSGIGSPGTLSEVLRGYIGDKNASEIYEKNQVVNTGVFPIFKGSLFKYFCGEGFLRPFELATRRLANMNEVISHWKIYMPYDKYLTQRGATVLFDIDNKLLYSFKVKGILGYSETMYKPLKFLDSWIQM